MLALPDKPVLRQRHAAFCVCYGVTDAPGALAAAGQDRDRAIRVRLRDDCAKADSHVEHREHLGDVDLIEALDERKDGRYRRQGIDDVADVRLHAGEVQQSVAGDVGERLDRWHPLEKLQRLLDVDVRRAKELGSEIAGELGKAVRACKGVGLEECPARQGEPVAVDAVALDTDDGVAFADMLAHQVSCRAARARWRCRRGRSRGSCP